MAGSVLERSGQLEYEVIPRTTYGAGLDMKKIIITSSEEQSRKLGVELWRDNKKYLDKRAVVFALVGELGAGKTQLVKGLAKAMGVKDDVISPTFTLEAEYDLGKLIHIDAWRIEDPNELLEIGFKKRVQNKKIIVIEWADQVEEILKQVRDDGARVVWIRLEYPDLKSRTDGDKRDNERIINIDSG